MTVNIGKRQKTDDFFIREEKNVIPQASKRLLISGNSIETLDTPTILGSLKRLPCFQISSTDICNLQKSVKNKEKEEVSEYSSDSEGEDECLLKYGVSQGVLEKYKKILRVQYGIDIEEFTEQHLAIIKSPHYADNENDFFQKKIDLALKAYMIVRFEYVNILDETIFAELNNDFFNKITDSVASTSFFAIITALYAFEKDFPKAFREGSYKKHIKMIENIIVDHMPKNQDIKTLIPANISDLVAEEYIINRSPKDFMGNKMIVGCGRGYERVGCTNGPHDPAEFFFVDKYSGAEPDIEADIYSTKFWNEFSSDSFVDIEGEGIEIICFTPFFSEISRILKKDGTLTILFPEILDWLFDTDEKEISAYFSQFGFSKTEIFDNYPELNKIRLTK